MPVLGAMPPFLQFYSNYFEFTSTQLPKLLILNRFKNFSSKRDINKHNLEYEEGKSSFFMKYTKFSDRKTCPLGKRRGHSKTNNSARGIPTTRGGDIPPLPRSFDWRSKFLYFILYWTLFFQPGRGIR